MIQFNNTGSKLISVRQDGYGRNELRRQILVESGLWAPAGNGVLIRLAQGTDDFGRINPLAERGRCPQFLCRCPMRPICWELINQSFRLQSEGINLCAGPGAGILTNQQNIKKSEDVSSTGRKHIGQYANPMKITTAAVHLPRGLFLQDQFAQQVSHRQADADKIGASVH